MPAVAATAIPAQRASPPTGQRHLRQEGVPTPLPQSEVRRRQSATRPVEASVQYWLVASGPTLQDVLACSGSCRELGAGACRHRPVERPTIRGLAAGHPAIPGTVQECPVDEACAETLPLYFRGERNFRNDAPLALMTDFPHEPRIGYHVTARREYPGNQQAASRRAAGRTTRSSDGEEASTANETHPDRQVSSSKLPRRSTAKSESRGRPYGRHSNHRNSHLQDSRPAPHQPENSSHLVTS
jgi:hypothetical protein